MAEQQKDIRAMIEILRHFTDRRDGKAFVAENPALSQKFDALQQDSRLQTAIQLFIPQSTLKTSARLALPDSSRNTKRAHGRRLVTHRDITPELCIQ